MQLSSHALFKIKLLDALSNRWRQNTKLGILHSSSPVLLSTLAQNALDPALEALLLSCRLGSLDTWSARCSGGADCRLEAEVGAGGGPVVLGGAAAGRLGGDDGGGAGGTAGGWRRVGGGEGHAWKVDARHFDCCCGSVWWSGWCGDCGGCCEVRKW